MNLKPADRSAIQSFAENQLALDSLSKDALIEIHRKAYGKVGDTARNSKADYMSKLVGAFNMDELRRFAAEISGIREAAVDHPYDEAAHDVPASPVPPHHPAPAEQPAPPTTVDPEALDKLGKLLGTLVKAPIDEKAIRGIVQNEMGEITTQVHTALTAIPAVVKEALDSLVQPERVIVIRENGERVAELENEVMHPLFEKVRLLVVAGVNVMLVGPAGCGKSFLAEQVARALGRRFGTLHCTSGASESQITGWLLPVGDGGRFEYCPSEFATLYTEGNSVFLLDEMDAADPNMLMIINGALANGHLHVPHNLKCPAMKRGVDAAVIAATNTFGTGADRLHTARAQLDAATLDRFYIIQMGYDARLEAQIMGANVKAAEAWAAAPAATPQELRELGKWVLELREKATGKLSRVVSTRMIQKAVAARSAGIPSYEVKRDLLAGWSKDELAKVGENF